jgi:RNA polymerase sigma factor (sigma-70 family)
VSSQHAIELIQASLTTQRHRITSQLQSAWMECYAAHDPLIRGIVERWHFRPADVDDVVQDVWSVLANELPAWDYDPARGTVEGWVAAIAFRCASRHARRISRHPCEPLSDATALAIPNQHMEEEADVAAAADRDRVLAALQRAFASLPHRSRGIAILHYVGGLPVRKIAAALHLPENDIRMHLKRSLNGRRRELPVRDHEPREKPRTIFRETDP